jgi:hypothetical protein
VPRSSEKLPGCHVRDPRLRNRTILDSLDKVFAPKACTTWHDHVHASKSSGDTGVLGIPVGHDEPLDNYQYSLTLLSLFTFAHLEAKLGLEKAIEGLAVGTAV